MRTSSYVMNTYGRLPITLVKGRGSRVWDDDGKSYLDLFAGIAVNTLGHAHPRLIAALQDQVGTLIHTCNYFGHRYQEELAEMLAKRSGMDTVFFCSTGLEANEGAIKIARKFGHNKGIDRPVIIVFNDSFHGRSLATLSATGNAKIQAGFEPLVQGFIRLPFNDIEALTHTLRERSDVAAVMLEPIQGEGGIHVASHDFLQAVRNLCDEKHILMMLDEVQTGMGRTGKWFAYQWADVVPDVMTLAKGLGSGVPIGAVVAKGAAATTLTPGSHGSTFGGNHLATRAGVETIAIMEDEQLVDHADRLGAWMIEYLNHALNAERTAKKVMAIRGKGLMLGIELARPIPNFLMTCAKKGLLTNVTADTVIRLIPALNLTQQEAQEGLSLLCDTLKTELANA